MNKEETSKIIGLIKTAYPNREKNNSIQDISALINLWYLQFENVPYKAVIFAVNKHISINKYPPTIADIKDILAEHLNRSSLSGEEAWKMLLKSARCNFQQALEEYEKLPDDIKSITTEQTLIEIGYSNKENQIFLKRDFLKRYEPIIEEHKKRIQISFMSDGIKELEDKDDLLKLEDTSNKNQHNK